MKQNSEPFAGIGLFLELIDFFLQPEIPYALKNGLYDLVLRILDNDCHIGVLRPRMSPEVSTNRITICLMVITGIRGRMDAHQTTTRFNVINQIVDEAIMTIQHPVPFIIRILFFVRFLRRHEKVLCCI